MFFVVFSYFRISELPLFASSDGCIGKRTTPPRAIGREGGVVELGRARGRSPRRGVFHVLERDEEATRAGGRNLVWGKIKHPIDVFAGAVIGWPVRDRCCLQYEACERPSHT